ncbi:hypothetical protein ABT336_08965 [Micromonospora sp. NPDC000207]|uniref:hypothetical protein n=1 Tax=Micromonospora sp. NPDC000207 TaxID=3154246 RepID=UPI0033223F14
MDNGVLDTAGTDGRRYLPTPCPREHSLTVARPASDELATGSQPYPVDRLSHTESAQLIRAREAAESALTATHTQIDRAVERVVHAWHRAKVSLHRLEMLAADRRLHDAVQDDRRNAREHSGSGPEDPRNRPVWQHPTVVWSAILVSAVYDTAFFAESFRDVLDVADSSSFEYWAALLPGVGIVMALVLAGSLLGTPLHRHRHRAERRPVRRRLTWAVLLRRVLFDWRPQDEERHPDDPYWPSWVLPVTFTTVVVGVLGVWAYLRGDSDDAEQRLLQLPMVALLVLLTLAAIGFKANAHNPYADQSARLRRRRRRLERRYGRLVSAARRRTARHGTAWQKLHSVTELAATLVRRPVAQAWTEIAEERGRHGLFGTLSPPFHLAGDASPVDGAVFAGLTGPELRLTALRMAVEDLNRYRPELLRQELDAILPELNSQLSADGVQPTTSTSPGGSSAA